MKIQVFIGRRYLIDRNTFYSYSVRNNYTVAVQIAMPIVLDKVIISCISTVCCDVFIPRRITQAPR